MRLRMRHQVLVLALAASACGHPRNAVVPATSRMQLRSCSTISLPTQSSEDIVIDQRGGFAFISSDPRRSDKRRSGAIYAYDLARRGPPTLAIDTTQFPFIRPHGMGLFTAGNGDRLLFVVNHRGAAGDAIQIFRVNGPRLDSVATIADPLLARGNDVVPVGPRSFYVTNSHASRSRGGMLWETIARPGRSYVLFYDGRQFRKVAGGLTFANGVNVNADGRRVYVTTTRGKDLRIYDRRADDSLALNRTIQLRTGPDNIDVDSSGGLWVAAHPSAGAFFFYAAEIRETSPSQILYFPNTNGSPGHPELVAQKRPLLPASSVAVRHGNRLLIGSVSDHVLDCELVGGPPR